MKIWFLSWPQLETEHKSCIVFIRVQVTFLCHRAEKKALHLWVCVLHGINPISPEVCQQTSVYMYRVWGHFGCSVRDKMTGSYWRKVSRFFWEKHIEAWSSHLSLLTFDIKFIVTNVLEFSESEQTIYFGRILFSWKVYNSSFTIMYLLCILQYLSFENHATNRASISSIGHQQTKASLMKISKF